MRGGIKRTAADIKFSKMIRERDHWTCQRCLKQYEPGAQGLHCAHNFSRRCGRCTSKNPQPHVCTRLDPSNALALDFGCHQYIDSHSDAKEKLFRLRFGNAEYDRVAAIAHGKRDRLVG